MATDFRKLKRHFGAVETSTTGIARQWFHAEDTGRIVVTRSNGTTRDYFWNSLSLAKQTGPNYGATLIGHGPIANVAPVGGSVGDSGTVQAMTEGVYNAAAVLQPSTTARNTIQAAADVIPWTIKAWPTQTAFLTQWLSSAGGFLAGMDVTGQFTALTVVAFTLTTASDATVGNNLTVNGWIKSLQSGDGSTAALQLLAVQPTIRMEATGQGTNAKEWDFTVSGLTLLGRTRTDALGTGATWITVTRSTTTISSVAIGGTAVTVSGTLGVTGLITATAGIMMPNAAYVSSVDLGAVTRRLIGLSGGLLLIGDAQPGGGAFAGTGGLLLGGWDNTGSWIFGASGSTATNLNLEGSFKATGGVIIQGGTTAVGTIIFDATNGLAMRGKTGSSYDLSFVTPTSGTLLRNPTGTQTTEFLGTIILAATSAGAAYGLFRSANGLTLRGGAGASNDLTLMAANATIMMRNPTGTTGLTFDTAVTMASTLGVTGAVWVNGSQSSTGAIFSAYRDDGVASGEHFIADFGRQNASPGPGVALGYVADGTTGSHALIRSEFSKPLYIGTTGNHTAVLIANTGDMTLDRSLTINNTGLFVTSGPARFNTAVAAATNSNFSVLNNDGVSNAEHYIADFGGGPSTASAVVIGYNANGSAVTSSLIRSFFALPLKIGTTGSPSAISIANAGDVTVAGPLIVTGGYFMLPILAAAPGSPSAAMMYYNNVDGHAWVRTTAGGGWVAFG